jgi:zinc/manganese transport system substrate-binding protein
MILKKGGGGRQVTTTMFALILGSLALAGCTSKHSTPGVIDVVGAEVQYGDVMAQIGGSYVHVTSIVNNPNTDPHNFEASPSVAQAIASAQLVVQNGAGYDSFMNQLESASPSSTREVMTVSSSMGDLSTVNPHLWYRPSTMPWVAIGVANFLAKTAPRHAAYFRGREAAFLQQWGRVTTAIVAAKRRYGGESVATTEPVADYLLSAMGLVNRTPFRFQADVMNGIDPSPEDIVTQQHLIATHAVRALCFNAQVSSPVTLAIRDLATKDHVPTVAVYEIMPTGLHVQTWMLAEISAIEAALSDATSTGNIR